MKQKSQNESNEKIRKIQEQMRLNERSNDTILDKNNSQATDRLSAYNMSSTKNPGTTTSSLF